MQGIERMGRRIAQRDAEVIRPPVAPAVGVLPLRRQFGRALLAPMAEDAREEHGPVLDLHVRGKLLQPVQADVGEGRNEVRSEEHTSELQSH